MEDLLFAGDRQQPEVWPAAGLGSHSSPAFLHCPGACPSPRSQAEKSEIPVPLCTKIINCEIVPLNMYSVN